MPCSHHEEHKLQTAKFHIHNLSRHFPKVKSSVCQNINSHLVERGPYEFLSYACELDRVKDYMVISDTLESMKFGAKKKKNLGVFDFLFFHPLFDRSKVSINFFTFSISSVFRFGKLQLATEESNNCNSFANIKDKTIKPNEINETRS